MVADSCTTPYDLHLNFQVETIGDAYCVAGGLHKTTNTHAQRIAWMALKMIHTCASHQTHDGKPIKVEKSWELTYRTLKKKKKKNMGNLNSLSEAETFERCGADIARDLSCNLDNIILSSLLGTV